jgi:uncharacterized protein YukJ
MPLKSYGVLKGSVVGGVAETDPDSPHYQIHVKAAGVDYRVAVNVKSQERPSELLYVAEEHFEHPVTDQVRSLDEGFTALPSRPGGMALDFIRGNLFKPSDMRTLPPNVPGPDNDLGDRLGHFVDRAAREDGATTYVFGERWGPERGQPDKVFHFEPGNGVHDVHMNQGNVGRFTSDDGVWQDGGLLLHFPDPEQWVGIFLAFQSQAWHTDDTTGHAITEPGKPGEPGEPVPAGNGAAIVRIVGALVNPVGPAPERERVTLLNASPQAIDLGGWAVADRLKNKAVLPSARVGAGETFVVDLPPTVQLGNDGGVITLLDPKGLKVDGVSYTKQQGRREGWTTVF